MPNHVECTFTGATASRVAVAVATAFVAVARIAVAAIARRLPADERALTRGKRIAVEQRAELVALGPALFHHASLLSAVILP